MEAERTDLENGKNRFRERLRRFLQSYTGLFLTAFLVTYCPFWLTGRSFVWTTDGRLQHLPALIYIGNYWRTFLGSVFSGRPQLPMFDLALGLGEDVLGTLNYYGFGDPLTLISVLVPPQLAELLYNALIVLRLYLAGRAFLLLCRYFGKPRERALVGSILYVFCGYAVFTAVRHPFFLNPMIQLPLLVVGTEKLLRREKPALFIAIVWYMALCGFYFAYMMTLLCVVYALVRFFDLYKERRLRQLAGLAARAAGSYLLGLGLAAPVFIPAVAAFLSGSRSSGGGLLRWLDPAYYVRVGYRKNAPPLWLILVMGAAVCLAMLLPAILRREKRRTGLLLTTVFVLMVVFNRMAAPAVSWDHLGMATVCFVAVVILLRDREKHRELRRLVAVAAVLYCVPLWGYVLNGFAYPSWRWTFAFALLLAYTVVELTPELLALPEDARRLCRVVLVVYAAATAVLTVVTRRFEDLLGVAMLFYTLRVLEKPGKSGRSLSIRGLTALVLVNVGLLGVFRYAVDGYIGSFTLLGEETRRIMEAPERQAEPYLEANEGRFDGTALEQNLGMTWGVPDLSSYWSVMNKNVVEFWTRLENASQTTAAHKVLGSNRRTMPETLLSVRYVIEPDPDAAVPFGYERVKTENGAVYENAYALPWGYTYDSGLLYEDLEPLDGLGRQEAMLQGIALDRLPEGFPKADLRLTAREVPCRVAETDGVLWEDGVLTVERTGGTMTLEGDVPAGTECYLRLTDLDVSGIAPDVNGHPRMKLEVECGGETVLTYAMEDTYRWHFGRTGHLVNLGYDDEARTVRCTVRFGRRGVFRLGRASFAVQPMEGYRESVEALRRETLESVKMEANTVSGTVELTSSKLLCISIPYGPGWQAEVDGRPAEILRGNYMFMVLPLAAGRHEVVLRYHTPGLAAGVAVFLVSAAVAVAWTAVERRKKRRRLRAAARIK